MKFSPRLSLMLSSLLLASCGALNIDSQPAVSFFTLNDLAPHEKSSEQVKPMDKVLLISQADANPFYDSTQLAFARTKTARAYYQYAAWTERPQKRLVTLIERRLTDRGRFSAVASNTAGIRGDLLLNLALDEIYHDSSEPRQLARIVMQAALIDARTRTLIAKRTFTETEPVKRPDAVNAVASLNIAATTLTDNLTQWVEEQSMRVLKPK